MMRRLLAALTVLIVLAVAAGSWAFWRWNHPRLTQTHELRIAPGATLARSLTTVPGLRINQIDRLVLRVWQRRHSLKPGIYTLPAGASLRDVLLRLTYPSEYLRLTIVEGDNMYEVARKLDTQGIVPADQFLRACRDRELVRILIGVEADRCEGFLWPETYSFAPYGSAETVLRTMVELFWRQAGPTLASAGFGRDQPQSVYRIVTLASIVEKETGAAHERPLIASVFLNRLIRGMRLQSDPTTIYGIWERFDGNLRKVDLLESTPYNTYRINGLTPTPIANPGLAALSAALNPQPSNYLYFVAKGSAGVHEFTETYEQHLAAIKQYQLR